MRSDNDFKQPPTVGTDVPVDAPLSEHARTYASPLLQTVHEDGENSNTPVDSGRTGNSLVGRRSEYPLQYRPCDLPSPIHNIPIEVLLRIFQLIAPPRTRDGLYDILKLTHVCRFWRVALINQPRVWSTVHIMRVDRRSFVETCLKRSYPVALDIVVDASRDSWTRPSCTCDKGGHRRLLPNESNPCEWHFQFESLAEAKHTNRIRALNIDFDGAIISFLKRPEGVREVRLALGSCRFFASSFPQLTTLTWKNEDTEHANHLFSTSPFVPPLRSLAYVGSWDVLTTGVNNLTSFKYVGDLDELRVEDIRLFLLNNLSLESLTLEYIEVTGDSTGPPACLPNLKSLSVSKVNCTLSTTIRVPALQHLSSLRIGPDVDLDGHTLYATGDGITLSVICFPGNFVEQWEDLTAHTKPTIRHIHLQGSGPADRFCDYSDTTFASMLSDVHTLEIGSGYFPYWYDEFLDDLKQVGPQLKIIRLEISNELEPFPAGDDSREGRRLLDSIEELVQERFFQGMPLSAVERMVTSDSERVNREQDFVWRCLYKGRELGKFVQPG